MLASVSSAVQAQTGLQFNGSSQYVTFGQATSTLGTYSFTLELWFKRTGTGAYTQTGTYGITAYPLLTKGRSQDEVAGEIATTSWASTSGGRATITTVPRVYSPPILRKVRARRARAEPSCVWGDNHSEQRMVPCSRDV